MCLCESTCFTVLALCKHIYTYNKKVIYDANWLFSQQKSGVPKKSFKFGSQGVLWLNLTNFPLFQNAICSYLVSIWVANRRRAVTCQCFEVGCGREPLLNRCLTVIEIERREGERETWGRGREPWAIGGGCRVCLGDGVVLTSKITLLRTLQRPRIRARRHCTLSLASSCLAEALSLKLELKHWYTLLQIRSQHHPWPPTWHIPTHWLCISASVWSSYCKK